MISIYLSSDRTQMLKAKIKKDKLELICGEYLTVSYLDDIRRCDVNQIIEMFLEIKAVMSTKSEEVYLVLPDHLFARIDCLDFVSPERMTEDIEKSTNLSQEDICISYPIEVKNSLTHKKTVCIMAREMVEVIVAAAKETDITLVSIEPASIAYLRSIGEWTKEKFIFMNYGETSSIISYSPVAGLYSYVLTQNISQKAVAENPEKVNQAINEILLKSDSINQATFGMANPGVIDVHMLVRLPEIYKNLPSLENRQVDQSRLPDFVDHDIQDDQAEWSIAAGALLQDLPLETYVGAYERMHFATANVMPNEARMRNRFEQMRKTMKKYSRRILAIAFIVLIVELLAIIYYSMEQIPDNIQQEYSHAQKELVKIEKELKIIEQSRKENQHPMTALNALISQKPQNLGFTMIEIGDKNTTSEKDSSKVKWVTFTAKTIDPMLFQDYTTQLSEQPVFKSVSLNQISSDSSDVKSARVTISKGKVE